MFKVLTVVISFIIIPVIITVSLENENHNPFRSSFNLIDKINSDPQSTWKAGQNFDPNLPPHYIKKLLGLKRRDNKERILPKGEPITGIEDHQIPAKFDARKKWRKCKSLQQIRDQGDCGSCWAVAAASTFTDRLCIATKGKWNGHLSAEELLSCCSSCGFGCNGGYDDEAWDYFNTNGIVTGGDYNSSEGCQPYELQPCEHHTSGPRPSCPALDPIDTPECKRKCTNSKYKKPFLKDHKKVKKAYYVDQGATAIQKEILKYGPVEAGFTVYDDFLSYKSGVYSPSNSSFPEGGHAVKLIGWGVEKGTPYWLVQNSWNYDWGDKGLFKIVRGKNICGFESEINAGIVDKGDL